MKYRKYSLGQLEAICNKIGGEPVMDGILHGTVEIFTKVANLISHTFMVLVDETLPIEDMVKAGKFDYVSGIIDSKNFPLQQGGKKEEREIFLFNFYLNSEISFERVIVEMDRLGYKPATIWELLGLVAKEPDLQQSFRIVAFGSACGPNLDRQVAYVYANSSDKRVLRLGSTKWVWYNSYRFAAVKK